jgi:hypothetical protein
MVGTQAEPRAQRTEKRQNRVKMPIGNALIRGMMLLSVIRMCSGHTSVQHLVMLHNPRPDCVLSAGTRSRTSSGCESDRLRVRRAEDRNIG